MTARRRKPASIARQPLLFGEASQTVCMICGKPGATVMYVGMWLRWPSYGWRHEACDGKEAD